MRIRSWEKDKNPGFDNEIKPFDRSSLILNDKPDPYATEQTIEFENQSLKASKNLHFCGMILWFYDFDIHSVVSYSPRIEGLVAGTHFDAQNRTPFSVR